LQEALQQLLRGCKQTAAAACNCTAANWRLQKYDTYIQKSCICLSVVQLRKFIKHWLVHAVPCLLQLTGSAWVAIQLSQHCCNRSVWHLLLYRLLLLLLLLLLPTWCHERRCLDFCHLHTAQSTT
jgi:hypothetical protein